MQPGIAILGEYTPTFVPHAATDRAIAHSRVELSTDCEARWVSTADINSSLFEQYSALWIAPGSPYKSMDKLLWAIRYAREHQIPCLGTCGGFQHMVLEYARNVLGVNDAQSQETDPYASHLFITQLDCSLAEREMQLTFAAESQIAAIYGALTAVERYYCNFGVNPDYVPLLKSQSLKVTGSDHEGEVRVIELSDHPFFIGTLFVPQARSTPETPHPIVTAFLRTALQRGNSHATSGQCASRLKSPT